MTDDDIHDMMDRAHYAEIREARLRIEVGRLKAEKERLNGVVESLLTERRRTDGQRLKPMAENERLRKVLALIESQRGAPAFELCNLARDAIAPQEKSDE